MIMYIKQQADNFIKLVKQKIEAWSHHPVEKLVIEQPFKKTSSGEWAGVWKEETSNFYFSS